MAEYDDMMDTMRRGAQTQEACPPATGNIQLNMENRQKAIDEANYGPANPALDETGEHQEFWQTYADPEAAIEGGDLGYCDAFDFKCASMRVCFSWAGRQE